MFSAWLTLAALAPPQVVTPPPEAGIADVVVTARPGPPPQLPDAVEYLRRLCFDPLRLTGRFAPPVDDAEWRPLAPEDRARFGAHDPDLPAYGLADPTRGHTLLVKFERLRGRKGWNIVEDRCTLAVIGGGDHRRFTGNMAALFRASGTRRHLGERGGPPRLPGWDQLMWAGMPNRRASNWSALRRGGPGNESSALIVFDPAFYDEYQYVLGDLKTRRDGARPVSILSFARVRRTDVDEKGRPLAGPPLRTAPIPTDQKSR